MIVKIGVCRLWITFFWSDPITAPPFVSARQQGRSDLVNVLVLNVIFLLCGHETLGRPTISLSAGKELWDRMALFIVNKESTRQTSCQSTRYRELNSPVQGKKTNHQIQTKTKSTGSCFSIQRTILNLWEGWSRTTIQVLLKGLSHGKNMDQRNLESSY